MIVDCETLTHVKQRCESGDTGAHADTFLRCQPIVNDGTVETIVLAGPDIQVQWRRRTRMSQVPRGIVRELHDEPHLEGRRITVRFVKEQVEDRGLDPRTVADRHDLDVADVYRALTYYHDNPAEMRTVERDRRSAIEDHEHLTTDPDDVRN